MSATEFHLKIRSDSGVFVRAWLPKVKPRAAVQIVHGMAEHGGRYARFATALNRAGLAAYALDLPGHGRTARAPDELGHFADHHGWRLALQTLRAVHVEMRERHPQIPLMLFGHSMGSFLSQDYLVHHGRDLAGCVLSGTTGDLGPLRLAGMALLRAEVAWAGARHPSRLAEELAFKTFNRHFKPPRTPFDWLSRDEIEVDRYIDDPRCGFRASAGLWTDLLGAAGRFRQPARLARIPRDLSVLMIAGGDDPACKGEKGPRVLARAYAKSGMRDVSVRIYPGARHELLNETCRDEVTSEVIEWLIERIPSAR